MPPSVSKSGLEPTGDCDHFSVSVVWFFCLPGSKSGLEPTGDCDFFFFGMKLYSSQPRPNQDSSRQAIVTSRTDFLVSVGGLSGVQIRTRADRRL